MTPAALNTPAAAAARRAKIVCTLGPACASPAGLRELIAGGMDVARLNCAHGDAAWRDAIIADVRRAAAELNREVAVLLDLAGPKIRTGPLAGAERLKLAAGAQVILVAASAGDPPPPPGVITTSHDLAAAVAPGDLVLLSDGLIELRVEAADARRIACRVVNGGELAGHQGVNLPGAHLPIPALTPQDIADLHAGLAAGVDLVALSFVQTTADVQLLRAAIQDWAAAHPEAPGAAQTAIIAKLEKPRAITDLEGILACADAVMVARGDLGVELPPEQVPALQKRIIRAARRHHVPVITATQMLESMTAHPRPTRAEATDVANAVWDGSDALMLSGETASGQYPAAALAMMGRIIVQAEAAHHEEQHGRRREEGGHSIAETIAAAIAHAARELPMAAIAVYTQGGETARQVAAFRPPCPVFALAANPHVRRRLALLWGLTPLASPEMASTDEMLRRAERELLDLALVQPGQVLGIVAGVPFGVPGHTNLMRIVRVGE
ncbi:MAG: pyruvate kinase [Terriglobales bacterium]